MRILSGKTLYVASGLKRLLWPNRHQRGLSDPKTHFLTIFFIGRRRPSFPVFRVNVDPVPQALVRTIQHQGWRQLWALLNTSTLKSTSQSIPTQSDQGHHCPCAIYICVQNPGFSSYSFHLLHRRRWRLSSIGPVGPSQALCNTSTPP